MFYKSSSPPDLYTMTSTLCFAVYYFLINLTICRHAVHRDVLPKFRAGALCQNLNSCSIKKKLPPQDLSIMTLLFALLFTIFSSIWLFVGMLCVIKAGLLSAKIDLLQKYTYIHTFSTLFFPLYVHEKMYVYQFTMDHNTIFALWVTVMGTGAPAVVCVVYLWIAFELYHAVAYWNQPTL